jgi:hypothetical protein
MSNPLQLGRTYYGPGNERLTVLEVDGERVRVMRPVSLKEEERSLSDMLEFIKGSPFRTYDHKNGERRTKREETDTHVLYVDSTGPKRVTLGRWKKWRAGA